MNASKNNFYRFLTITLMAAFLLCGILVFRDYGASSDEINQIQAGHITWNAVLEKLGLPGVNFGGLPDLKDYYNRYYGQAATFPTVVIEALKGFSLDVSTVLRLRHAWNFFLYFSGLICLALLTKLRFGRDDVVFFLILFHILTPRLFGDAFYNDRDVMLVSLLWISLFCHETLQRKPSFPNILLCAFFFALAVNTRFLGLVLLFLPIMGLFERNRQIKRSALLMLGLTFLFWYIFTPVFWGNLLPELKAAFHTFATGEQRTQETGGMASILFFGRYFKETELPFYYLPLWIFISTPLVPQILTGAGIIRYFRSEKTRTDRFMFFFLFGGIAAVMLIRPVQYNGWRHFYFLYVPLYWFMAAGLCWLLSNARKLWRTAAIPLMALSAVWTGVCAAGLHPYEYLYLNPLFRDRISSFDRDYWRLSTRESLEWIIAQNEEKVSVGEINENLDNSMIALLPKDREKISILNYNALHRYPPEYLIFNYTGMVDNDQSFPLYEGVHSVERENVKLAEIYQRIPAKFPGIAFVSGDQSYAVDGNPDTEWRGSGPQSPDESIVIGFSEEVILSGLSILPGNNEQEFAGSPEVSVSPDGEQWETLPLTVTGLFDLSFPAVETRWLRIRNTEGSDVHWSVREIYFY